MQQSNYDDAQGNESGDLPAVIGNRPSHSLTIARNQQLSLNLKAAEGQAETDDIDLLSYWRILVKRRWTVLSVLGIVLVTALVGTLLTTPIYRATATLQIERNTIKVVNVEGMNSMEEGWSDDFYQTQYELLRSRTLAQRVASQMGLADSGEMAKLAPVSPWAKLGSIFTGSHTDKAKPSNAASASSDTNIADRESAAVGVIEGGLSVEPIRNSRLVRVNFDSPDGKFAQRAANAVAEAFIASNLERRFDSSAYAKGYLEDQLQQLKLKLSDSERKLVEFAQKEQIVATGDQSGNLSEQTLNSLNAALSKAKEDRIGAEARWSQAQASRGLSLMIDDKSNSIIKTLQENRAKLMSEYQDKLGLYKPAYPLMLQLKSQIDEVDKQISAETANIRASVQAEYLAAVEQERLLTLQITSVKSDVLDLQGRSIQYNIYKRDVDTNRQLYDSLLQRYKEIGIAGGDSTNNISIIDRAEEGGKFKPSLSRNLSLAMFAGLFMGVLLAFGIEYLDDTLKSPEDVEQRLGLGVLGVIPRLRESLTPDQALQDPRSAFAESYRSLRTALQFSTEHGVPRCLLVTSSTPSEGKSTTAMVLAQYFTQLGKSVLLIDCDLRNPTLHRQLGVENSTGLTNFLSGAARPEEIISKTQTPNLFLVPCGPLPPNPAELLMGAKMLSLLTVAVRKYDQVILDGPPVMGLADAPILANMASGTLMVIEAGDTRIAVARNALKRLLSTRAHVIGALLTKYDSRQVGYGYGYGYGYDYGSSHHYTYGGNSPAKLTKR